MGRRAYSESGSLWSVGHEPPGISSGGKSPFGDGSFTTNSAWDSSRIRGGSPPNNPFPLKIAGSPEQRLSNEPAFFHLRGCGNAA